MMYLSMRYIALKIEQKMFNYTCRFLLINYIFFLHLKKNQENIDVSYIHFIKEVK